MVESLAQNCSQQLREFNTTVIDRVLLRQVSPKDAKWDDRRAESDRAKELYSGTIYDALAGRIAGCSGRLEFGFDVDQHGKPKFTLQRAWFCRVRTCPVCQWRRSLMWRAKAFKILPKVIEDNPNHRFIFLTLTVRNCELTNLRATVTEMAAGWARMTKRKNWPAHGWIRSLEVTRSVDGTAHPHFHCLLMVPAGYFSGKNYLSQQKWTDLWRDCMRLDYQPMVNVQAVKEKKGTDQTIVEAILETIKYTVKPDDLVGDGKQPSDVDQEWLVELTTQLHKIRAMATGGVLKEYLKELEQEPEDLIHVEDKPEDDDFTIATVTFDWQSKPKKYVMRDDEQDIM
jgi:plasmid rolling circle replication initiator protein Rep